MPFCPEQHILLLLTSDSGLEVLQYDSMPTTVQRVFSGFRCWSGVLEHPNSLIRNLYLFNLQMICVGLTSFCHVNKAPDGKKTLIINMHSIGSVPLKNLGIYIHRLLGCYLFVTWALYVCLAISHMDKQSKMLFRVHWQSRDGHHKWAKHKLGLSHLLHVSFPPFKSHSSNILSEI